MITITINDRELKFEEPVTILTAARSADIWIPTLCFNEKLKPYGGCRVCLVEVKNRPVLFAQPMWPMCTCWRRTWYTTPIGSDC